MSGNGLVQRKLAVTFVLAGGKSFVESGSNTAKIEDLRMKAKVVKAGGPSMGTLQIQIFGMTLSLMNQLSTLGMLVTTVPRNTITLEAGDSASGMAVVFQGTITAAWTDFLAMPDVSFLVEAHTGLIEAVAPQIPTSIQGDADVATIMSGLATQMGLSFENNGVNAKLSNPYFSGAPREQAEDCADAAGIAWVIDNGKLAIWPKTGSRGGSIPEVSPATGAVGYPEYTAQGIKGSILFNPSITFGGQILVKSDLQRANGTWAVFKLDYDLHAQVPNGDWFLRYEAYNPKFPAPVAQ